MLFPEFTNSRLPRDTTPQVPSNGDLVRELQSWDFKIYSSMTAFQSIHALAREVHELKLEVQFLRLAVADLQRNTTNGKRSNDGR